MTMEWAQDRLARLHIPDPDCLVPGSGDDMRAVGGEDDARDAEGVTIEHFDYLVRCGVPNADHPVP